jgi:hypothetical protein
MADQSSQGGAGHPAPPPEATPDAHAGTQDAAQKPAAARAPLGEWRGPVFWMACGALLAGLLAGTAVLVQRVAIERDMMAVAATLPQAAQAPLPAVAPGAAQQEAGPASAAVSSSALPLRQSPALPDVRRAADDAGLGGDGAARHRGGTRPSAMTAKPHARPGRTAGRKHAAVHEKYAEVFKRCPQRGKPGALQCRRDICNGAEGSGPACKRYVRKLP